MSCSINLRHHTVLEHLNQSSLSLNSDLITTLTGSSPNRSMSCAHINKSLVIVEQTVSRVTYRTCSTFCSQFIMDC